MKTWFHFIATAGVQIAQMCKDCNNVLIQRRTFVNIFLEFEGKALRPRWGGSGREGESSPSLLW
jgi:hypothetical protein